MLGRGIPVSCAIALVLTSCANLPERTQASSTSPTAGHGGGEVRWGGIVAGKRSTDAGECIEIATLEINRTTGVPLASAEPGYLWSSTFLDRRGKSAPRFLACGVDDTGPAESARFGSLLTVTGTVRPSLNFRVDRTNCLQPVAGGLI